MENLTNQILELEEGKNYFVLRQASYKGKTYFLVVGVTPDEENFTNEFMFLEKVDSENDENLFDVEEVTDPAILEVLAKNIKLD